MAIYVTRDPFARETLVKRREKGAECAWCGRHDAPEDHSRPDGQVCPAYHGRVYRFAVETDGGRTFEDSKAFCTKSCRTAYNG